MWVFGQFFGTAGSVRVINGPPHMYIAYCDDPHVYVYALTMPVADDERDEYARDYPRPEDWHYAISKTQ